MVSISEAVKTIINSDDIANAALKQGYMNFSKYGELIKPAVEGYCHKPVDSKSIVMSISRLQKSFAKEPNTSKLKLLNISLHAELTELSYSNSKANLEKLPSIYKLVAATGPGFFTSTIGITEIMYIGEKGFLELVKTTHSNENEMPLFEKKSLVGISVKFPVEYLEIPNIIQRINSQLTIKNINIVEIISTTTELTYIIDRGDTEIAISQLSRLL